MSSFSEQMKRINSDMIGSFHTGRAKGWMLAGVNNPGDSVASNVINFISSCLLMWKDSEKKFSDRLANLEIVRREDRIGHGLLAGLKRCGQCPESLRLKDGPTWSDVFQLDGSNGDTLNTLLNLYLGELRHALNEFSHLEDSGNCRRAFVLDLTERTLQGWLGSGVRLNQPDNPWNARGEHPCIRAFVIPFDSLRPAIMPEGHQGANPVLPLIVHWMRQRFNAIDRLDDGTTIHDFEDSPRPTRAAVNAWAGKTPSLEPSRPLGRFKVSTGLFGCMTLDAATA